MKLVVCCGRLFGRSGLSSERSGGKLGGQIGMVYLKDPLGTHQIFEAALAEAHQRHTGRQRVAGQFLGGKGQQCLTAVPGGHEARDAIGQRPEVIPITLLGGARVKRDSHAKGRFNGPGRGHQGALHGKRACQRLRRDGERGAEGIAHCFEDKSAVRFDRVAQNSVMEGDGAAHGIGLRFPQPRTAFDVGEQKRDGAGRRLAHGESYEGVDGSGVE